MRYTSGRDVQYGEEPPALTTIKVVAKTAAKFRPIVRPLPVRISEQGDVVPLTNRYAARRQNDANSLDRGPASLCDLKEIKGRRRVMSNRGKINGHTN